jgi:hypothetical protein
MQTKTLLRLSSLALLSGSLISACDLPSAQVIDDGPASQSPQASQANKVTPEIAHAQDQARSQLAGDAPAALPYLDQIIASREVSAGSSTAAPAATRSDDVEAVQSALSWYCYPLKASPVFWTGVAAVKLARSSNILTSYSQCKTVFRTLGSSASAALFKANQALWATIVAVGSETGVCDCQYVF